MLVFFELFIDNMGIDIVLVLDLQQQFKNNVRKLSGFKNNYNCKRSG
jgi:hypothetical protein